MFGKQVFSIAFILQVYATEIKGQKVTLENVEVIKNGSQKCDFNLKYHKNIDSEKLNLTWYNQHNINGISYTLNNASERLSENGIFWRYPSLNIYFSGYGFSSETVDSDMIRNAYLSIEEPIMLIDYSAYSGTSDPGYIEACYNLYKIGEIISKFLIDMVDAGIARKDIHLIGISLGGQLVGNIARAFQRNYGANVGRVTALDPAGPCFDRADKEESTKKEDADFVEIYNFNRGQLGTVQILGHVNFLINGGGPKQKACERLVLLERMMSTYSMQCAHAITSLAFWRNSIRTRNGWFIAIKCDNLDQAIKEDCSGNKINAGFDADSSARGIFYLPYDYSVALTLSQAAISQLLEVVRG